MNTALQQIANHGVAILHLSSGYKFVGFVRLIDAAGTAYDTLDTKMLVEQSSFSAKTDMLTNFINRVY